MCDSNIDDGDEGDYDDDGDDDDHYDSKDDCNKKTTKKTTTKKTTTKKTSTNKTTTNEKITKFTSGNYSVTGFWIVLERKMTSHLLQMIMPSAMFVIVSWISFLMPLDR